MCKVSLHLQSQHDELEAKFFEERAALEAKYQKLYQPLYAKVSYLFAYFPELVELSSFTFFSCFKVIGNDHIQRYDIVNGVLEVEGVTNEAAADKEDNKAAEGMFICSEY